MEGGRLIEGGAYWVFLSMNCNFILVIEKQKLQHYPRKRNVNINVLFVKIMVGNQAYCPPIIHLKDLCKHIEIEITRSDLTEKKLLSCSDAAVVEA